VTLDCPFQHDGGACPAGGDRFDLAQNFPAFSGSEPQDRHCVVDVY
jgi:hypothetical protein